MSYSGAALLSLATQCAPNVAARTVAAIVETESGGRPLAININGPSRAEIARTALGAAAIARRAIASGYSVDLGLGQINSRNMRKLGLTWETVFDPCTNIAALGEILTQNYQSVADGRHPQAALRLAISLYNTGSTSRGFRNGYVARVVGNAGVAVGVTATYPKPAPLPMNTDDVRSAAIAENATSPEQRTDRQTTPPTWNLFERAAYERKTLIRSTSEEGTILWPN